MTAGPAVLAKLPGGNVVRYALRPFNPGRPVLMAIGSHPDDETMLAGGLLALAAYAGLNVEIVSVTRGEGGEVGLPPVTSQDRLGETREAELRCAAEQLGASGVTLLPFRDPLLAPGVGNDAPDLFRIEVSPGEFGQALIAAIGALQPAVLVTHGSNGEYGHPQHLYTHDAVRQVFHTTVAHAPTRGSDGERVPIALYTWAASFPVGDDERLQRLLNQDDPAEWLIEVRGDIHERKAAAAACHQSQHDLFRRHNPEKTLHEITGRHESLRRVALRQGVATDPLDDILVARPGGQARWIGEPSRAPVASAGDAG